MKKIVNEIFDNNPIFVQTLGMCPTLAVTTNATNSVGMGISTMIILIFSNIVISLLRKFIDESIRIPSYIVIIATFVTIVELMLKLYIPGLYSSLGIFIPLIVVNCIILGRAEAYASKNNVIKSAKDGLIMGIGFLVALLIIGSIREILGNGTFFNYSIFPTGYEGMKIMQLAPGAFLTLGLVLAFMNYRRLK